MLTLANILKYAEMSNHYVALQEHNVMGLLYFKTKQILRKRSDWLLPEAGAGGVGEMNTVVKRYKFPGIR